MDDHTRDEDEVWLPLYMVIYAIVLGSLYNGQVLLPMQMRMVKIFGSIPINSGQMTFDDTNKMRGKSYSSQSRDKGDLGFSKQTIICYCGKDIIVEAIYTFNLQCTDLH